MIAFGRAYLGVAGQIRAVAVDEIIGRFRPLETADTGNSVADLGMTRSDEEGLLGLGLGLLCHATPGKTQAQTDDPRDSDDTLN